MDNIWVEFEVYTIQINTGFLVWLDNFINIENLLRGENIVM